MVERDKQLRFSIDAFLSGVADDLVSISRLVNPLLSLWATAKELGDDVAAPLERLLAAAPSRSLISRTELVGVLDEVLAAAAKEKTSQPVV